MALNNSHHPNNEQLSGKKFTGLSSQVLIFLFRLKLWRKGFWWLSQLRESKDAYGSAETGSGNWSLQVMVRQRLWFFSNLHKERITLIVLLYDNDIWSLRIDNTGKRKRLRGFKRYSEDWQQERQKELTSNLKKKKRKRGNVIEMFLMEHLEKLYHC